MLSILEYLNNWQVKLGIWPLSWESSRNEPFSNFHPDLDVALFLARMPSQAREVVLNALASNDTTYRVEILERVRPEHFVIEKYRVMFEAMVRSIQSRGNVDIDQVRKDLVTWASVDGSMEFVEGSLVCLDQALSYHPTRKHVKRAIDILTKRNRLRAIRNTKK